MLNEQPMTAPSQESREKPAPATLLPGGWSIEVQGEAVFVRLPSTAEAHGPRLGFRLPLFVALAIGRTAGQGGKNVNTELVDGTLIGAVQLRQGAELRVTRHAWRGRSFLDLRRWEHSNAAGKMLPTKSGVRFDVDLLAELLPMLEDAAKGK